MDLRKLKKLIDLVEESGISELELTEDGEKVRISRNFTANQAQPQYVQYQQQPQQFNNVSQAPANVQHQWLDMLFHRGFDAALQAATQAAYN